MMWIWWLIGILALILVVGLVVFGRGRSADPSGRIHERRRHHRRRR
jgi:hypothetical protein